MYPIKKLQDCATIIAGQSPESKYYNSTGEGIPFFQGKADFGELYPKVRVYCSSPTKIAQYNDILLSVRAPVGPTNLSPGTVCIGRGLAAIRPDDSLDLKYLLYYFRYFETQLSAKGTGTTFKAINQKLIKNLEIPIPPLNEQSRIVAHIEELFSELDKAVGTLKTTKEQLEVYRQAVLKDAFSSCETQAKIKDVCYHVTDGDHMPPPKATQGIPFIMISNIQNNHVNWTATNFVGEEYYKQIGEKRTPRKGDILYTVTGSFGIPVMIDFDKKFCFQRHIALLRPNAAIRQRFLYYALQSPAVYSQATKRATGTAQKTVGLSTLRDISIPYTSDLLMQENIELEVKKRLCACDHIEKNVDTVLAQADAMRQSILKQAFEGKI